MFLASIIFVFASSLILPFSKNRKIDGGLEARTSFPTLHHCYFQERAPDASCASIEVWGVEIQRLGKRKFSEIKPPQPLTLPSLGSESD